jgi:membrane-associated protease RseP (regulator of RpoE activity)
MRTTVAHTCLTVLLLASAGCASKKVVHQRGWVGGEFTVAKPPGWVTADGAGATIYAFPRELVGSQKAAIFVSGVYSNTPLALAGIQVGDLILTIDAEPIESLPEFHRVIEGVQPGTTVPMTVFRDSARQDHLIRIGRETYQNWKTFSMGVGLSTTLELDLLPDPDFSLIALGYRQDRERTELHSPRNEFIRKTSSEGEQPTGNNAPSARSEGWKAWLAIFSLGGHKSILSQEAATDTPVALQ